MKRRDFIKGSTSVCLLLGTIPFTGCINYRVVPTEVENGKLKIKKSDFLEDKWVVVKTSKTNAPVFLYKENNETYFATLMICTHKECEVKPVGNLFHCPCHGAEFSLKGKVQKGPAETDLVTYATTTDENNIYIHVSTK